MTLNVIISTLNRRRTGGDFKCDYIDIEQETGGDFKCDYIDIEQETGGDFKCDYIDIEQETGGDFKCDYIDIEQETGGDFKCDYIDIEQETGGDFKCDYIDIEQETGGDFKEWNQTYVRITCTFEYSQRSAMKPFTGYPGDPGTVLRFVPHPSLINASISTLPEHYFSLHRLVPDYYCGIIAV